MDLASTSSSRPAVSPRWIERDPERELIRRAQAGDRDARDTLVAFHRALVSSIARRTGLRGTTLDDAVHEGVLGLLEAIDRFDVSRDNRFATYASYWVVDRVRRHARESRAMVRAPSTRAARVVLRGHGRASRELTRMLGRAPTRAEVAAHLGVDDIDVASCEPSLGTSDISIDSFDGGDPRAHVPDLDHSPEDEVANAEARHRLAIRVEAALASLAPRERLVVERRFLADEETSLTELGATLGISRERARQIQEGARNKLRRALAA